MSRVGSRLAALASSFEPMRTAAYILSLLVVVLAQTPVRAGEVFGFPIRVGIFGGWHATSDDYDVLGERRADYLPDAGPMLGLRLGWRVSAAFAVELEVGTIVAPAGGETAWLVPARLDLDWRALPGVVTPIVGLGAGFVANAAGPGSGDLDALFGGTLGVEIRLGDAAALRFEGGVLVTDGVSSWSWSPIATVGIDLLAWRERHAADPEVVRPPDPKLPPAGCPAGVSGELCRDSDADRRIDAFDLCPTEVGTRADGCPDPDADGVVGPREACPRDRGTSADWGCPR